MKERGNSFAFYIDKKKLHSTQKTRGEMLYKIYCSINMLWGWTSTLRLNRRTCLLAVFYLIKKIDVNSIYKVIDMYAYLDVR